MNPLDQLADIRFPEEVSAWPPALGYYVVLGLLLLITTGIIIYFYKRKAKLASRKLSLAALQSIHLSDENALQHIHQVLKTAVQQYLPERNVLQMQEAQWSSLLAQLYQGKNQQEVCEPLAKLAKWQYDQRIAIDDTQTIKSAAQIWIERALPVKKGVADV